MSSGPSPYWFSGRQVPVMLFKVNRWLLAQESLLVERIDDPLEHFHAVLQEGDPVETGRASKRTWFVGDVGIERRRRYVAGQVGWERPDRRELAGFDRETKKWIDVVEQTAAAAHAPFVYDGETGRLGVLKAQSFAAPALADVFAELLNRGEQRQAAMTAVWGVEPLLEPGSFRAWLETADAVERVTFVAKLPNPDMLPEFEPIVERLQAREARALHETWEARDPERGLQNIEEDEDARQMIVMAESGYGHVTARGRSGDRAVTFNQNRDVDTETTPPLPSTPGEMIGVVIDFVLDVVRRRRSR